MAKGHRQAGLEGLLAGSIGSLAGDSSAKFARLRGVVDMSEMGQTRPFHDVDSMSGLPENGHGWAFYEYTP
jgi:hypothetical protein